MKEFNLEQHLKELEKAKADIKNNIKTLKEIDKKNEGKIKKLKKFLGIK